ncbi:MAG: hypothetical protein P1V20_01305 [Verrucomicrobiales bacterium]|nr:hypothetical protein [Verrucomicrobiales bacterium]
MIAFHAIRLMWLIPCRLHRNQNSNTNMKLKILLVSLFGVVAMNGAIAGSYCPPPAQCDKCPIDCCEDLPGTIGISYMSDYFFRGVRYAHDAVALKASYTIDGCIVPVTIGFQHVTSLDSDNPGNILGGPNNAGGDQTDLFAAVSLPSMCGFDFGLRYDHYFYPNWRGPAGANGDSHGQVSFIVERDLFCGVGLTYTRAYDFNTPSAQIPFSSLDNQGNNDNGAWIHTVMLDKEFCITDCVSVIVSGGVVYTDNVWTSTARGKNANQESGGNSSGWNNYFLEATMPMAVGNCAILSPYIGYNGTPDSWLADGVRASSANITDSGGNDTLHGGVRLEVSF